MLYEFTTYQINCVDNMIRNSQRHIEKVIGNLNGLQAELNDCNQRLNDVTMKLSDSQTEIKANTKKIRQLED